MTTGGVTTCEASKFNELFRMVETLSTNQAKQDEKNRELQDEVQRLREENAELQNQQQNNERANMFGNEEPSDELPKYSRLIESGKEFIEVAGKFGHIAIRRASGEIHEYIIIGSIAPNKENFEVTSVVTKQNATNGVTNISIEEIRQTIADGNLFIIENPEYPQTDQEKEGVVTRFWKEFCKRVGKFGSDIAKSMSWLLTGLDKLNNLLEKLFKQGWAWLVDLKNCFNESSLRAVLRAGGCLLSSMQVSLFVQTATSTVVNSVRQTAWLRMSTQEITVNCYTETICKNASNELRKKYCTSKMLSSKDCTDVAKNASKESLTKSAMSNLGTTGVIEGAFALYDIHKLNEKYEKGSISKAEYDRQLTKTVSGAVGATVGSVGAGVIGQMVCPIPVVGYAVGSMVGNYGGRWLFSSVVD